MTLHKAAAPVPLEASFSGRSATRRSGVRSREAYGRPGVAVFGGYVMEPEKDPGLIGTERYRTFSRIMANCAVAGAGVRYFLNLCAKAGWTFQPAEHARGEELAERAEKALTEDPETSWSRIVKRAAMFRFAGFSIQEWVAKRADDGSITIADIAPRAQHTIERWDLDTYGKVLGVGQRSPQDGREYYIPRGKVVYLVDDVLHDSPQGFGLFRHITATARRLARYEQLEGVGYETDLRGVPVGYAPYAELERQVTEEGLEPDKAKAMVAPLEQFVSKHVKGNPELGLTLDSGVYSSVDDAERPSGAKRFGLELLQGDGHGLVEIDKAIERLKREIAMVLGTESLMLGDGDAGSHALSKDKTQQLSLVVDATLKELARAFMKDLLEPLWELNGWPREAMPKLVPETVAFRDVAQIAEALRNVAAAGVDMHVEDEAIAEFFGLLGLTPPDPDLRERDAQLGGDGPGGPRQQELFPDLDPDEGDEPKLEAA